MQTDLFQVRNRSENLSAQAKAARARAAAIVASFYELRHEALLIQLASRELKRDCLELWQQSQENWRKSAVQRLNRQRKAEARKIAHDIARTLCDLGIPAFVFEPPQDTAIQL